MDERSKFRDGVFPVQLTNGLNRVCPAEKNEGPATFLKRLKSSRMISVYDIHGTETFVLTEHVVCFRAKQVYAP